MVLWLSVWSEVQIAHGPADATTSQNPIILSSLASFKNKLVLGLPFWYRLTQVVLEKRQFNGCSPVIVVGLATRRTRLFVVLLQERVRFVNLQHHNVGASTSPAAGSVPTTTLLSTSATVSAATRCPQEIDFQYC